MRLTRQLLLVASAPLLAACHLRDRGPCEVIDAELELAPRVTPVQETLHAVVLGWGDDVDAIAVGDGGVIVTRDRDGIWTIRAGDGEAGWRDVALADDGVAVAVGGGGAMIRSDDGGATWEPLAAATTRDLRGVAVGGGAGGRWVAVGDGELLVAEAPAVDFARVELPGVGLLRGVAVDPSGVFLAVGEGGQVLRSDGGLEWSWVAEAGPVDFVAVAHDPAGDEAAPWVLLGADGLLYRDVTGAAPWLELAGGRPLAVDGPLAVGEGGWVYTREAPDAAGGAIGEPLRGAGALHGVAWALQGGLAVGEGGLIVDVRAQLLCVQS